MRNIMIGLLVIVAATIGGAAIILKCCSGVEESDRVDNMPSQVLSPNIIRICTPEWLKYTPKDGPGLYTDLWKEIYASEGITPELKYFPYKRIVKMFERGKVDCDAYPGGYESQELILPLWHIGIDKLTVVYKKGISVKWEGQISMKGKVVMWERGYDFDKHGIVEVDVKVSEYNSGSLESALKMLTLGRADFVIDYHNTIQETLNTSNISDLLEIRSNVINGPKYYMMFAKTNRGKRFAEIWDNRMDRLYKSGRLSEMYKRYGDPTY